jgi:hypothetical protein
MSASDHIHPMLRVYHASHSEKPPHMMDTEKHPDMLEPYSNAHPDIIHMGDASTVRDKNLRNRQHTHAYDIPQHLVYPATMGDEEEFISEEDQRIAWGGDPTRTDFGRTMSGVKEGLFETVPATPDFVFKTKMAVPYRNRVEGMGRVSYMVPKGIINQEGVQYVGRLAKFEVK